MMYVLRYCMADFPVAEGATLSLHVVSEDYLKDHRNLHDIMSWLKDDRSQIGSLLASIPEAGLLIRDQGSWIYDYRCYESSLTGLPVESYLLSLLRMLLTRPVTIGAYCKLGFYAA